eukprot:TRINITY_DN2628_c0_g1_i6.p2 TRINITY_DN2628_c0_g1~~TRINITY_DN2628_c0_g1_i6.p2  ORF type:complete len:150 (+),score=43.53 TRINITY_DN2628_c0_g1_i6:97-546(+)
MERRKHPQQQPTLNEYPAIERAQRVFTERHRRLEEKLDAECSPCASVCELPEVTHLRTVLHELDTYMARVAVPAADKIMSAARADHESLLRQLNSGDGSTGAALSAEVEVDQSEEAVAKAPSRMQSRLVGLSLRVKCMLSDAERTAPER